MKLLKVTVMLPRISAFLHEKSVVSLCHASISAFVNPNSPSN